MRSRRLLAAGFAAAIGIAGVTIGSGSLSASSGGGLCEGIDIGALAGSAPAGTESAGTAADGTEPVATEPWPNSATLSLRPSRRPNPPPTVPSASPPPLRAGTNW